MSGTAIDPRLAPTRQAPRKQLNLSWSDPRFRNIVWQVVVLGIVVAIVAYLVHNTRTNLEARHIATGFGFLGSSSGIPIGETVIPYTSGASTYLRALIEGVLNTLK